MNFEGKLANEFWKNPIKNNFWLRHLNIGRSPKKKCPLQNPFEETICYVSTRVNVLCLVGSRGCHAWFVQPNRYSARKSMKAP